MTANLTTSDRILRPKETMARLGISKTAFYNKQLKTHPHFDPNFPKAISLSAKTKGYLESEINAYIQFLASTR